MARNGYRNGRKVMADILENHFHSEGYQEVSRNRFKEITSGKCFTKKVGHDGFDSKYDWSLKNGDKQVNIKFCFQEVAGSADKKVRYFAKSVDEAGLPTVFILGGELWEEKNRDEVRKNIWEELQNLKNNPNSSIIDVCNTSEFLHKFNKFMTHDVYA